MRGDCEISGSRSTFRLGVKGSGSRMLRGKADRIRLRIWMHDGGMLSHRLKWWSQRNSGKSCSSTSSTRSVPLYSSLTGSLSLALRRYGSMNLGITLSSRWKSGHPFCPPASSSRGRKLRCEISSRYANANPGTRSGCTCSSAVAMGTNVCTLEASSTGSGAPSAITHAANSRKYGRGLKAGPRSSASRCSTAAVMSSACPKSARWPGALGPPRSHQAGVRVHGGKVKRGVRTGGRGRLAAEAVRHHQLGEDAQEALRGLVALEHARVLQLRGPVHVVVVAQARRLRHARPLLKHRSRLLAQPGGVRAGVPGRAGPAARGRARRGDAQHVRRALAEEGLADLGGAGGGKCGARGGGVARLLDERGEGLGRARALRHLAEDVEHGEEVGGGGERLRHDALADQVRGELGGGLIAAGIHELREVRVELGEVKQARAHQPLGDLLVQLARVVAVDDPLRQLLHQALVHVADALQQQQVHADVHARPLGALVQPLERLLRHSQ
eukprot:6505963-Pyramimonas_sp.AAC.2